MANTRTYRPLRRDRSKELDRLAQQIAELVNGGCDPVLARTGCRARLAG